MRRTATVIIAIGAAAWLIVVLVQRRAKDPEISNPVDLSYDAETRFAPDFFPSDPTLTRETPNRIQEQMTDKSTGKGLADAPYFVEIDDGRFAFGYADANGFTRPIYTRSPQQHRVYWYDDAWEHWNRRRGSGGDAADGDHAPANGG